MRARAAARGSRREQVEAVKLGTLYALGHGAVVIALGIAAIAFGALLPEWLDPIMGRIVGLTLVLLGAWVLYSVYRYARAGESFRMRSRWMLVFDGVRYCVAPVPGAAPRPRARRAARDELVRAADLVRGRDDPRRRRGDGQRRSCSSPRSAGPPAPGSGIPMLFAFVAGLLVSNFAIVVLTSLGFVASQTRERIYVAIGLVAGLFSLTLGLIYVFGMDAIIPEMDSLLPF